MTGAAILELSGARPIRELQSPMPRGAELNAFVEASLEPVIFRGAGKDLPIVQAATRSVEAASQLLLSFYSDRPVTVYRADRETRGRFHYTAALDGFNFSGAREELPAVLDELQRGSEQAIYVGSTDLDLFFPGIRKENDAGVTGAEGPDGAPVVASLWMGNRTITAAHYDHSNNCALCAAGRRRFTLFPPDQIANLYPGPLEPTPGGQVVSMVDFGAPDLGRYPRFAHAMETAVSAILEPGDIIVYPAMWWHQVEALEDFNILLNWWWNAVPDYVDTPQTTLLHALLSLRQRPAHERKAWAAIFDYYAFADPAEAGEHLPDHIRGPLGEVDASLSRRLRAQVTRKLQR